MDWVAGQRQASRGNTGRPIRRSFVNDEPVGEIRFVQKIAKCFALKFFQFGIDGQFIATHASTRRCRLPVRLEHSGVYRVRRRADRTTFTVSRINSGTAATASSSKQSASETNDVFRMLLSATL